MEAKPSREMGLECEEDGMATASARLQHVIEHTEDKTQILLERQEAKQQMPHKESKDGDQYVFLVGHKGRDVTNSLEYERVSQSIGNDFKWVLIVIVKSRKTT